jgi:cell division protein FtsB
MAAPIDGDTLFSDGDELEETGSADSIDRDSTTAPATGDTPFTARAPASGAVTGPPPDSRSAAFSSPPIKPEANPESTGLPVTAAPAPAEDDVPLPPGETDDGEERNKPEALEAQEDDVEDFDDEFVDDFLNDLDAPEDSEDDLLDAAPLDDIGNREDALATGSPDPMQNLATAAADTGATSMARRADGEAAMTRQPESKETERSLPIGMIAVVIIALALLAVGGYGVIQQRSELQAEIRDLQSRLATAPSAEEAAAERERQRQLALENESLSAEIEALAAENSALAEQLASLEDQLAQRAAEARAAEAAEAEARRAAEAAAQAAAARAATPATPAAAPAGPWFVNFGSYAERNVADRWAGKLKVDSGNVIVQIATASGKTLYRVRVVGLASQDAAERVATALEREYRLPRLWVGRN